MHLLISPAPSDYLHDLHDKLTLVTNKNVVDWDMHQLHKEANEPHDQKSNTGGFCNLHEFLPIGLCAFLNKVDWILGKLLERLNEHLIKSFLLSHIFLSSEAVTVGVDEMCG